MSSHQIANSNVSPKITHDGKLIVFEGGEGCGKTTQLGEIASWLRRSGWLDRLQPSGLSDLLITREPGGTKLCSDIRQLLLTPHDELMTSTTELLLYAADRAQHVEGCLRPALDQGQIVLCDRYTDSTMAYQGYGRGLDQNLITQLNTIATGGVRSNLTLWLDLDVALGLERAKERGKRDRIEEADFTFHQRVHQGFAALAKQEPNRVVRIDASLSKTEVTREIIKALEERFTSWRIQPSNPLGAEMKGVSQPQSNEYLHLVKAC